MTGSINQRVATCRKLAGLTQAEAAEKLGMKCSTYSQMERKGNISAQMVLDLANIFKVHPNVIYYGEDNYTAPAEENDFTTQLLKQTMVEPVFPADPDFVLSKQEESFIKLLRTLQKSDREEIREFAYSKYMNRKEKK